MPVIRVEKNKDFTVMSNYHLRDRSLSMKARGLLSTMLSLPPDWDYTVAGLATLSPDGKDSIRSAMGELEAEGYLKRSRTHDEGGKFGANDFVIYETPPELPLCENHTTVPSSENPTMAPSPGKPTLAKPTMENPTQENIQEINTRPPIPPKGERRGRREPKEQAEWKPERFEGLWKFYPLHKSKQTAYKAWDTLRPSDELIAVIGKALRRQKAEENWQRGIGIPYLSTYLNQRRWEDEPYEPPGHDASGGWAESKEVIA